MRTRAVTNIPIFYRFSQTINSQTVLTQMKSNLKPDPIYIKKFEFAVADRNIFQS